MDEDKVGLIVLLALIFGILIGTFTMRLRDDIVKVQGQLPTAAVEYKGKLYKLVEMQP